MVNMFYSLMAFIANISHFGGFDSYADQNLTDTTFRMQLQKHF